MKRPFAPVAFKNGAGRLPLLLVVAALTAKAKWFLGASRAGCVAEPHRLCGLAASR